jgi:molybdenum cofactor biosynthesis enzyme MoaA
MFFGRNGMVSACCVRREPPYGSWPERSIAEIWFGDERKRLDRALQDNILPLGCDICADQLLAGNFRGTVAATFDRSADRAPAAPDVPAHPSWFRKLIPGGRSATLPADTKDRTYPIRLEFELSNKCNLECAMCSGEFSSLVRANREGRPPLTDVYDERFVQQLREFIPHLKEADFRGGEPFIIEIYHDIWELLMELNPDCVVSITTNGTALSPRIKRVLENLNAHVIVSIDSLHAPTYESIRRNAKLDRVLANIDTFHEIASRRQKTMGLAFCAMPSNWQEIPDLVSFANARNATIRMNTVYYPAGSSIGSLPYQRQAHIAASLRQSLRSPNSPIEAVNNKAVEDFCLQVEHWTSITNDEPLVQLSGA